MSSDDTKQSGHEQSGHEQSGHEQSGHEQSGHEQKLPLGVIAVPLKRVHRMGHGPVVSNKPRIGGVTSLKIEPGFDTSTKSEAGGAGGAGAEMKVADKLQEAKGAPSRGL